MIISREYPSVPDVGMDAITIKHVNWALPVCLARLLIQTGGVYIESRRATGSNTEGRTWHVGTAMGEPKGGAPPSPHTSSRPGNHFKLDGSAANTEHVQSKQRT